MAPVELSIVCFRYRPVGASDDGDRLDRLNKAIMEEIQSGGEAFVTQASIGGRFSLRANVMHYGTSDDDLPVLIDAIRHAGGRLDTQREGDRR